MPTIADIFRLHGPEYIEAFGPAMLPSHRRAMHDIIDCRTEALGGDIYQCTDCGAKHYVYHSCRNRSCPTCGHSATEAWLNDRRGDLLPVEYFHVIFTLPAALRQIVRSNQKPLYGVLMKSAPETLMKVAANDKTLGGQIGVMAVLHTSGRTIDYHPHVHCLVPGGALAGDQWRSARKGFLLPVRALSKVFRGIFMAAAAKALPDVAIPKTVWDTDWVVYCKPVDQGADTVLQYLGRYLHRGAVANSRIVAVADGKVTFRYQKSGSRRWRTMTLEAGEFIRRYLQHVLPKGLHKVRYYGLWAVANRHRLASLQSRLAGEQPTDPTAETPADPDGPRTPEGPPVKAVTPTRPCPACGKNTLVLIGQLARRGRPPP
jgi:hypothetical protein